MFGGLVAGPIPPQLTHLRMGFLLYDGRNRFGGYLLTQEKI
jgi:hypothetical protein